MCSVSNPPHLQTKRCAPLSFSFLHPQVLFGICSLLHNTRTPSPDWERELGRFRVYCVSWRSPFSKSLSTAVQPDNDACNEPARVEGQRYLLSRTSGFFEGWRDISETWSWSPLGRLEKRLMSDDEQRALFAWSWISRCLCHVKWIASNCYVSNVRMWFSECLIMLNVFNG